ncbi:MAG: hypothetical protein HeimC3_24030 [Candidatus Heimdallarchaeota archaeon LC_3]|nr:MAG: hypothetical protein HeimC3_24030 [Candidatus Heimdallarchaeota archaeon LC_3]
MASGQRKITYEILEAKTNPKYEKLFGISFIVAILINLLNILLYLGNSSDFNSFISLLLLDAFPTVLTAVLFYNERSAKSDYLRINIKGVAFKSTPVFPHGLRIKKGFISFDSIKYVSLAYISSGFKSSNAPNPQKDFSAFMDRPLLLNIVYGQTKRIAIGERFPNKNLLQSVVLLEAGAGLTQTWKKITEKYPDMKETISEISSKISKWFKNK